MSGETAQFHEVIQFATYDDYIDSFVTEKDIYFLGDATLARDLVATTGKVISREDFLRIKAEYEAEQTALQAPPVTVLAFADYVRDPVNAPFMTAIADREDHIKSGKLVTLVFLLDRNARGEDVSGFIDLGERFLHEDMLAYARQTPGVSPKKMLPSPHDLSFRNWRTQKTTVRDSSMNFDVIERGSEGLVFRCRRDGAIIDPSSSATSAGPNTIRYDIAAQDYEVCVIFDHMFV